MKNYDFIFFDLDGTINDSADGIINSFIYALEKMGMKPPERSELFRVVGPPLSYSFNNFFGFTKEQAQEAIGNYRVYYAQRGAYENRVYDGIPELLKRLSDIGKKLYLASSKAEKFVKILSDYFGVSQYFDVIRGSDESVGRYSKADVIRQVIADAGIDRIDRCVMVGDRRFDAEGAAECGMDSIGVLYGYGSRQELTEAGATYFAGSVEELGRMLGV